MLTLNHTESDAIVKCVTIGADPEFLFVRRLDQAVCNAHTLLHDTLIRLDDGKSNLGWDGAAIPGELRPHFSTFPIQVVKNMADLFTKMNQVHPTFADQYDLIAGAGANGHATGGHIHIGGVPGTIIPRAMLSHYLDTFLLPVGLALSRDEATLDRLTIGYGAWAESRDQTWGTEYRSLPSWLYHPMTALFFLQATKALTVSMMAANLDGEALVEFGYSPVSIVTGRAPRFFLEATLRGMKKRAIQSLELLADLPQMRTASGQTSTNFIRDMLVANEVWEGRDLLPNWLNYEVPADLVSDLPPALPPELLLPIVRIDHPIIGRMQVEYANAYPNPGGAPTPTTSICNWNSHYVGVGDHVVTLADRETEDDDDEEEETDDWFCDTCDDYHPAGDACPHYGAWYCSDCEDSGQDETWHGDGAACPFEGMVFCQNCRDYHNENEGDICPHINEWRCYRCRNWHPISMENCPNRPR